MTEAWNNQVERIAFATLERGKRIVGVTSPQTNSGVTSLCETLARLASLAGARTLLVDLTGRAESTAPGSVGLPGEGGAGQSIRRDEKGFDRLVARFQPDERYLFNNVERLRRSLEEDLAHYEAVIVDMPPVPTNDNTRINCAAASAACDAVLLVCMSGRVSRNELNDSLDALANAQANVLGTILNDMQNPTLGAELAREARKMKRFLPRVANWLERKANGSVFLN